MSRETEDFNRRLLRARDAMDRSFAEPLDVRTVAAVAHVSGAHFSRSFREVFGETPHRPDILVPTMKDLADAIV